MADCHDIISELSLEESKTLLLQLAQQIFACLEPAEKRSFIVKMAGSTGEDKIGSMVQL